MCYARPRGLSCVYFSVRISARVWLCSRLQDTAPSESIEFWILISRPKPRRPYGAKKLTVGVCLEQGVYPEGHPNVLVTPLPVHLCHCPCLAFQCWVGIFRLENFSTYLDPTGAFQTPSRSDGQTLKPKCCTCMRLTRYQAGNIVLRDFFFFSLCILLVPVYG